MNSSPETDPQLGRTLGGHYRIDALLGSGGMGRVYRGVQLSVKRPVAIKLIAGSSPHPPEWVQRFRREAEATARLSHPNSVRLFDFGVTEAEELYMVMELLEGADLACHLHDHGRMQLPAALSVTRQVLMALCEAHTLGVIHRDLKPDNIFLARVRGGDEVAKVMDFGIAGLVRADAQHKLTSTGVVIGTPAYMSPEQAQGQPVDAKCDLYSLGVVLFEMLTGRPPFESHTAVSLLVKHVTQRPKRLDELGLRIPRQAAVQELLDGLLAKDPQQRPSTREALAVVEALVGHAPGGGASRTAQAHTSRHDSVVASIPRLRGAKTAVRVLLSGMALAAMLALGVRWLPALRDKQTSSAEPAPAPLRSVNINSLPSGARVLLDGAEIGKTPYAFRFRDATELSLVHRGYERQLLQITPSSDASVTIALVREPRTETKPLPRPSAPAERPMEHVAERAPRPEPVIDQEPPAPEPSETSINAASDREHTPDKPAQSAREEAEEAERASSHRGLKIFGRAVARAFGKLLIPYPDRARREALADQPLAYPSFREARRAYDRGAIDSTGFQEAVWQLRERRRHGVQAERDAFARGELSQAQYDARVDRVWDEFWGR